MHARSTNLHAGARSAPQNFLLILDVVTIKKSGLQSLRALNHARQHITISDAKQLIKLFYLFPKTLRSQLPMFSTKQFEGVGLETASPR